MKKIIDWVKNLIKKVKDFFINAKNKVVEFWEKVKKSAKEGDLRKLGVFLFVFAAGVGALGTIGYLIYLKKWFILLGALLVDLLASKPYIKLVKELIG